MTLPPPQDMTQYVANMIMAKLNLPTDKSAEILTRVRAIQDKTKLPDNAWGRAVNQGDVLDLYKHLYRDDKVAQGAVEQIPHHTERGVIGAIKRGYLDRFHTREGYARYDASLPTLEQQKASVEVHPQWGLPAYAGDAEQLGYRSIPEKMGYRVGALGGDIASNATRHWMWNIHPNEVTSVNLWKMVSDAPNGYVAPKIHFDSKGNPHWQKGSKEGAMLAGTGAFLGTELLNQVSGNYNPMNIAEGGRPSGYTAITANEDDPRKSDAPALDVIQRYLLGRKGRVLPWDEFHQERPNISYEKYSAYKNWQQGKDDRDLLNKATLGIAKFNSEGLNNSPELSVMGMTVTPLGVAAAVGTGLAFRKLNSYLGTKALNRFNELDELVHNNAVTNQQMAEYLNNPFNPTRHKLYAEGFQPPSYGGQSS